MAPGTIGATAPTRSSISASISGRFWPRWGAARCPSNTAGSVRLPRAAWGCSRVSRSGRGTTPADAPSRGRAVAREHKPPAAGERRAVRALIGTCALVTLFWAAYDQQGNNLLLWAEDFTDRSVDLGFWRGEIPSPSFLALNPFLIFMATPLLVALWARQGRRGTEPFAISKMAFGCL